MFWCHKMRVCIEKVDILGWSLYLAWCKLCYVKCTVDYCSGQDVQITNKKILSLSWCQPIYVLCAVHYST